MRSKEFGRKGGEVGSGGIIEASYSSKCLDFSTTQAVVESNKKAVILVNPSFAELS